MQYYDAQGGDTSAPQSLKSTYGKLAHTMDTIPLSTIMPTEPSAATLNVKPRAPQVPPASVPGMNFAQETYKKGEPAPGDDIPAGWSKTPPGANSQIPAGWTSVPQQEASWLSSPNDIAGTVGQRLSNLAGAPYHAFADNPQTPVEQDIVRQGGGGWFGRYVGLPLDRLLGASASNENFKLAKALTGDAKVQAYEDAVPIVGPWAKQIESDVQNKGALAGVAGLATDVLAPKAIAKTLGVGFRTAGTAARAASATPESLRLAGTRLVAKGTPGELLQSALKPAARYGAGVSDTLQEVLPYALKADPELQGVSGFARAADAARDAQFGKYDDLVAPYRRLPPGTEGPVRSANIHGSPIARAQLLSIPPMDLLEDNPAPVRLRRFEVPDPEGGVLRMGAEEEPRGGIVQRTKQLAGKYDRPLSVPLVDAIREDANAKLNSFYNKAGGDQHAALSNPETARVKAVGDTSRQLLYPQLENNAGLEPGTVEKMQRTYGKLSDAADIANKREPVYARHDPVTLAQKVAVGHGGPIATAFNWAKERALNNLTNSDALVNSAVDRYQNPFGTPLQPRQGILPKVTFNLGRGAQVTGKFVNRAGNHAFAPAANPTLRNRQADVVPLAGSILNVPRFSQKALVKAGMASPPADTTPLKRNPRRRQMQ